MRIKTRIEILEKKVRDLQKSRAAIPKYKHGDRIINRWTLQIGQIRERPFWQDSRWNYIVFMGNPDNSEIDNWPETDIILLDTIKTICEGE